MSRLIGVGMLVLLAGMVLYLVVNHTAPPEVVPGAQVQARVVRAAAPPDGGSLDNLLDVTQIHHAIGGR